MEMWNMCSAAPWLPGKRNASAGSEADGVVVETEEENVLGWAHT